MAQTEHIKRENVIIPDRYRKLYRNIEELADSIARHGMIQPIVIDQNNQLVVGGRRMRAAELLELDEIPFRRFENLTEMQRLEMELEENLQRENTTWQEDCLQIRKIHMLKKQVSALEGELWTQHKTAIKFGVTQGWVSQILPVAAELEANRKSPIWDCVDLADAYRTMMASREAEAKQMLAEQTLAGGIKGALGDAAKSDISGGKPALASSELLSALQNINITSLLGESVLPTNTNSTLEHAVIQVAESVSIGKNLPKEKIVIDIGRYVWHGDSLQLITTAPDECVDHVLTDPPYMIEMSNIQQDNVGMNVDATKDEHDVEVNTDHMKLLVPQLYRVLRDKGWCVLFCDAMHFRWLHDLAIDVGFKVTRWPYVWCKTTGQNSAAGYNPTKSTEFAILMRKGNATLVEHMSRNWDLIGKGPEDAIFGHPFAKPLELWAKFIQSISKPGEVILDPHLGCGSMFAACIKTGRKCMGIEVKSQHIGELMTNLAKIYREHFPQYEIEFQFNKYRPLTDQPIG